MILWNISRFAITVNSLTQTWESQGWMERNGLFDLQKIINFFCLALKEKESSNVFKRESALAGRAKSASSPHLFILTRRFPGLSSSGKIMGQTFIIFFLSQRTCKTVQYRKSDPGKGWHLVGKSRASRQQWWCHHNLSPPLFVYFHRPDVLKNFRQQTNAKLCHKGHKRNAAWASD